ncbi:hypothetical protein KL921_001265 [Ogataea angusta]|uniref:Uncharacterized protein n=1 Tax=Pichia angusta TaxID=870730 RepID=A0AAN6DIK4_PICAN|nr:uncharacterized protein KL928_001429 [Ogataea angusta]KAG7813719.1 hypothetical protein KL921_001265 [Ogataea angusta]KAG7821345.1 hypothetical protein KL928_001429 [Ogataea angusta]KAG7832300.1 hypothetical protein KL920_000635 [Ogataea angusta]KAG7836472.1 hypothetical protein KL943_002121 [Ogataea angusta]KAG7843539.1 hypothetical protein KL942_000635 [Ogataea angusta]
MSIDHFICPTVFIRSIDRHTTNEDSSPISWSDQQLNILEGIAEHINPEDHQFSVSFNFTELSKSWQISKDYIYDKIIELYYIRSTSPNDFNVENSCSRKKQTSANLSTDKEHEKSHPIHELELLKINPLNLDHSHTVEFHYRKSSFPVQNPSLGVRSMRFGPLDADNSSTGSSDESAANMAETSAYLFRSKFIHRETPYQINQAGYDLEQEYNDSDCLLAGTTESLTKSLLEQELLDRI